MITRRDLVVACLTAGLCAGVGVMAQQAAPKTILGPAVFDWNELKVQQTDVGFVRNVVRQPTATLDELEMHVTTLKPGIASHEPHRHVNEELVIIREGTVETLSDGVWKRVGPGSIIFNASNSLHGLRNVGTTPAVYHVINWSSPRGETGAAVGAFLRWPASGPGHASSELALEAALESSRVSR